MKVRTWTLLFVPMEPLLIREVIVAWGMNELVRLRKGRDNLAKERMCNIITVGNRVTRTTSKTKWGRTSEMSEVMMC